MLGWARAPDDPRLARRHRDLPGPRDDGAGRRSGRADRADRERAGIGRPRRRPGTRRGDPDARWASADDAPVVAVHRHVRALSGARSALRGDGASSARAARRAARHGRRRAAQVAAARASVSRRSVSADVVIFTGQRPAEEMPAYLDAATVLVSPRSTGTNTPLKIYQYLRSGRPIVATRSAHAHAGAVDDDGVSRRADAGGVWRRRLLGALDDPGARRGDRRSAPASWPRRSTATRRSSRRREQRRAACSFGTRPSAVARGVA